MSATYSVQVGNKGRVVVPAEIREHRSWGEGAVLIAMETDLGVVLMSRDDARRVLRTQFDGQDLVASLLADRRAEATAEAS